MSTLPFWDATINLQFNYTIHTLYGKHILSDYKISSSNVINTWIPIKLNRYDFKQLFLKSQRPVKYIRNTMQGNSINLNGYWTIFKVYDSLQKEIKILPDQFTLSDNAIPIDKTDLSYINQNNIQKTKQIQTIYNNQLIVSPTDENPISLTLDLKRKYNISKILISHIPDNRIFYNNIVEISEDGINWEIISDIEYNEKYGGKSFYFFNEENIVFINNNVTEVDIDNQPILKSICYAFDIDNNYQFYMVKNETINNKLSQINNIYMYYQKNKIRYNNVISKPQQELIVDFTNTNYDNTVDIIKQRYIKFILPPDGININEIEIHDMFGINILKNKQIYKYSDNFDTTYINSFKFITDGVINTTTDYAKIGNSIDNDYQYIIYDLGKEYPITSIKLFTLYQNDNEITNSVIYNFKCEYSKDNESYTVLYDTNRDGMIFSSPIGKELLKLNIEYDTPLVPISTQYIRYKYIQQPTLYRYIPFLPKLKNEYFMFTYTNQDYHNIKYTNNIVFKELLNTYVTVNYKNVVYNYNDDYKYYISIIDDEYTPYIEYQLPTILNVIGLTIINNYINNIDNISFSIDGVNYIDLYNEYYNKINPNIIYIVKNYGIKNDGIYISELSDNSTFDSKTIISFNDISMFDMNNKILFVNFVNIPQQNYDDTFSYTVVKNSNFSIIVKYVDSELQYGILIKSTFYKLGIISTDNQEEIYIGMRIIYNDILRLEIYTSKNKTIPIIYTTIDNISITNSSQTQYVTNSSYTLIGNTNIEFSFSTFKLNYIYLVSLTNINDIETVPQLLLNII